MGGKSSPPPAPDYAAAAKETAAGNREAAVLNQMANMVNQKTPYGTVSYTPMGLTPEQLQTYQTTGQLPRNEKGELMPFQWQQEMKLSPEQQAAYERDVQMNAALQGVGQQGVGYVQQALNKPLSTEGMQALQTPGQIQQQAADAAYQNAMRYVEPRLQRQQAALETQLANQGISRDSEAWNNAMQDAQAERENIYGQAQNQAYLQGLQGAGQMYSQGLGTRQQQLSEAQLLQQNPINMLNAVRTGAQMQTAAMPQVGTSSPGQMGMFAGPDLLGATTAQGQYAQGMYNAQQAAKAATMGGLMSAAGTGIGAYAALSDERAKQNVIKIGALDNGLNLYSFEYRDEFKDEAGHGRHVGVMAQEVEKVLPEAVHVRADGYKTVNYGVIYGHAI